MDLLDNFQKKVAAARDTYVTQPANAVSTWWGDLTSFASKADDEAEMRFPDQARDNSQKNAYRHALGAGRLAQLMGYNSGIPLVEGAARGFAKLAGYGWEIPGGPANWDSTDMRHDLNADAFGIAQSSKNQGYAELANSLESFARTARREPAPEPYQYGRPYLTYMK